MCVLGRVYIHKIILFLDNYRAKYINYMSETKVNIVKLILIKGWIHHRVYM